MAPRHGRREDLMSTDISFDLERLFDPYNFDHIPKDERLKLFKQRDLPHIKHYKAAVKIFGGPPRRTRVIEAPPMETPLKHRIGLYHNVFIPPQPPILNGSLKPPPEPVKKTSQEEKNKNAELEKTAKYKEWIQKRQGLRHDLNSLGLNEGLLSRKTDKTELEKRVEGKFRAERTKKPETPPPVEETPPPKPPPDVPTMTVPPPDGLQILDKFLSLNRMRLIDLFRISDKDKSWSLSRTEFLNAVSQSEIPLGESEVDDLFICLDADLDDELNYQELNKGLMQWRKQRRDIKKQSLDEGKSEDTQPGRRPISRKDSKGKMKSVMSSSTAKTLSRERVENSVNAEKSLSSLQSQGQSKSPESKMVRERSFPELKKMMGSRENSTLDKTDSVREKSRGSNSNAAEHSAEDPGKSLSTKELSFSKDDETNGEMNRNDSQTNSQQRVQVSASTAIPCSRENVSEEQEVNTSNQSQEQGDQSVYEDVLFEAGYTPRPLDTTLDTATEDGEKSLTKTQTPPEKSTSSKRKPGSAGSNTKSRSSTPNSLEPPEFDTRIETRAPESMEAMLDMRKHDQIVLSRNTMRRNLSHEQRVTFDELPGVIKVGYKPIDDHCSESTLGGEAAGMVNQFRRTTLKEYFEVQKMFEERGLRFNQKTLDRVLLYPGDRTTNILKKDIGIPLGPLTYDDSPFNQPKPKKRVSKRRRGFSRMRKISGATALAGLEQGGRGTSDDERGGSGSSKRSFITVEDVYPFASTVAPKVYKENLSSGRALITRKVDSWMTFEEYCKYTEHLPRRFQHFNRPSNPDADWPGTLLDKLRLFWPPYEESVDGHGKAIKNRDSRAYQGEGTGLYNGRGHAVFRSTAQHKLAYPGYNNDLLTWPVGDNGVIYGNIDEHRLIK